MNPNELAAKYFGDYREKDGELIPTYCPFCRGGKHNDKHTFAMNADNGTYNCKRGKCGVQGSFRDILNHFGEHTTQNKNRAKHRSYRKPTVVPEKPNSKVEEYLQGRGLSRETWEQRFVGEKNGNVCFPYYRDGEIVLIKYRNLEKGKQKKYWQEGGGRPVLWGMDDCDPSEPLVITEGEFDACALTEAGVQNAVSIPFGTENLDWIEECWEFLDSFDKIILWTDNDEAGRDMLDKVIPRLGEWRCAVVGSEHNDANICLYKDGKEAVRKAVESAEDVPLQRLLKLNEVEPFDPTSQPRVLSGVKQVNKYLGGYLYGGVTVWTGQSGSGKSTFLGQELIEVVDQGVPVCAYSGELPASLFRYWIDLQLAGPNVEVRYDEERGEDTYYVPKGKREIIGEWYEDMFFLYDSLDSNKPDDIMSMFEGAAMRYGAKCFLIDNLMTIAYGGQRGEYYHRQSEFVTSCKEFANKFNVHVHFVAHPKKSEGKVRKEDVAGLLEITNKADNVVGVHRLDDDNKAEFPEDVRDCDAVLDILKSRVYGRQKVLIGLMFDEMSKRFYPETDPDQRMKAYGWEDFGEQASLEGVG